MKLGLFAEIGVIDILDNVAFGEALDQHQATALPYMNNTRVRNGGYEQCSDADIIIIAAGPSIIVDPEQPNTKPDRTLLTKVNAKVIREVMVGICKYTKEAIVILITNPLDTMVYIAENEFNYPKGKIFGTGTMLDSARLRRIIADNYNVDTKSIVGYMMGEHGFTGFPVLSHLNIGGIDFTEVDKYLEGKEDLSNPDVLKELVISAAYDVFNGKGWTNAGVAQAAVTMAKAILLDENSIFPASTTMSDNEYNLSDVALSIPCVIGRKGIVKKIPVSLNGWEKIQLEKTVSYIKETMKDAKTGKNF